MKTATKSIYFFEEGNPSMRDLLGGKGANLAEMSRMGFPVPPGFTITTEVCNEYIKSGNKMPPGLKEEIRKSIHHLEEKMGKKFGGPENPLLVSVRSGAKFSMPGMMDTILNLGLNSETVEGLARITDNKRFAYDSYRRFIQMFSDVVLQLEKKDFEDMMTEKKKELEVISDSELTADVLKNLVNQFKDYVKEKTGEPFPEDVYEQLYRAVEAVFRSWNNPRAIVYRAKEGIPDDLGTAVNVQCMVFGNTGDESGTGVAFTRNASTGDNVLTGDFLFNAQGEDVVAGIRNPLPLSSLKDSAPHLYRELEDIAHKLEHHYKDLQDMEFTVQDGKLYMLQTRNAKRTAQAAIKVAVDMVDEGLITEEEAVLRISPEQIEHLLHPYYRPQDKDKAIAEGRLLAKGIPASPGAASGMVVFDAEDAIRLKQEGKDLILVRPETTPDDAQGMLASRGILTSTGGPTSHAALVARGWGIPCVVGCEAIYIDLEKKEFKVKNRIFREGDNISIDGGTGEVIEGLLPLVYPTDMPEEAKRILGWADKIRKLGVYANADNPRDVSRARSLGAEGIGLCRTEHMFMESERLPLVQDMILVAGETERAKRLVDRLEQEVTTAKPAQKENLLARLEEAKKQMEEPWAKYRETLDKLLPFQKEDFKGILAAMEGLWVIIRLLDPPLHEFLPSYDELLVEVTKLETTHENPELKSEKENLLEQIKALKEFNPMLGLRVCRLGIVYPEIYKMQVRAIFEAACELKSDGVDVKPEVMIPGVSIMEEMKFTREMVDEIARQVMDEKGIKVEYKVGTMMELPRACLVANDLAKYAQFFSFGTNDLTQTTFGYSRDDASGTFIPVYLEKGLLPVEPFMILDQKGVGRLMKLAVKEGRQTNPELEIGICGEHGGEPASVEFCHRIGLNYVSCSPYRIPIARLSAAHAVIKEKPEYNN
ncbi:MAG: pyruvate, phosphate dikinase [Candidatus Eremiobacteraeota bacterium]|nr:pyruvate, phosphate dikinase [Candidatus Eremiobacteraeota bacterium]